MRGLGDGGLLLVVGDRLGHPLVELAERGEVGVGGLQILGLAAEHVGDAIEFTDSDGILEYVNPAY